MKTHSDITDRYWDISREADIESYFNPINLSDEKLSFKENYYNSVVYNPVFEYESFKFNQTTTLKELQSLKNDLQKSNLITKYLYIDKVSLDIISIEYLNNRNNADFPKWLTSLYGIPNKKLLSSAIDIINRTPKSSEAKLDMDSNSVLKIFERELSSRNFLEWNVISEEIPAKISINPVKKIITIKSDVNFSSEEIQRLIAHEVDVHVLRNENGSLQPDKLFCYGFPSYLKTEEGLAITSEFRQNLLENNDLRKYCSRVIGSYNTNKKPFYELFNSIKKYHTFDQTYSIVSRIKRGLIDTSILEGYTKDQVYLDGFLDLKKYPKSTIHSLFCGKIGVADIKFVKENVTVNTNFKVPAWVEKL